MEFVDLSREVTSGMPVYPGDPEVTVSQALTLDADGVAVAHLDMGSHTGTHLDAPSHTVPGGRTVEQIPLHMLWGPARVLRVRADAAVTDSSAGAGRELRASHFEVPSELPRIVCIETGWDNHFTAPDVTSHPYVSLELAELLWARGARVLCVDALSPDPSAQPELGFPVHDFWLGNDGVIVENLTGLDRIPDEVELSLLPLRLAGVDGSPIRAVAALRGI